MEANYKYQEEYAQKIMSTLLDQGYAANLLAATPGAGKTTISHIVLNYFTYLHPKAKTLVLTEGQNTLRNQYLDELSEPNVDINFTYGNIDNPNVQVMVGLPHSRHKIASDYVDLLIVDEAHHFYTASMVQSIIKKYRIKHVLLMTGSPSKFVLYNNMVFATKDKPIKPYFIAAEDLLENNVFSHAMLHIEQTERVDTAEGIHDMIQQALNTNSDLSKIMVVCRRINQAQGVATILEEHYGRKVSLSTSDDDKDNTTIQRFKKGITDSLVVVNRGILGFNDPLLTTVLDMKQSDSIDIVNQLAARVLRKHPDDVKKSYIKGCCPEDTLDNYDILKAIVRLLDRDVFKRFDGTYESLYL